MMKITILLVFTLIIGACSPESQDRAVAGSAKRVVTQPTSRYAQLYLSAIQEIDKQKFSRDGSYYKLAKLSDSSVTIAWGTKDNERAYKKPLDFRSAEKLHLKWSNKYYLILQYGVGSGAWVNVVLPTSSKEDVRVFDNGLYFDTVNSLLVTEHWKDTVFTVHNLKTGRQQYIVERNKPCDATGSSLCVDTLDIRDKVLYYNWVTPNKYEDNNSMITRRIKLAI